MEKTSVDNDNTDSPVYAPAYPPTSLLNQDTSFLLSTILHGNQDSPVTTSEPILSSANNEPPPQKVNRSSSDEKKIRGKVELRRVKVQKQDPKSKSTETQKKLTKEMKHGLTTYQARDITVRLKNISPQDLLEDDAVPHEPDDEVNPTCCFRRYYVAEEFDDPRIRAKFMAKTMFLMTLYLLPAILVTGLTITWKRLHYFMSAGWKLYLMISCGMWLGIHVVGYQIRNFRADVVIFICRSIAFAHAVTAITLATELLVVQTAFEADYFPKTGRENTSAIIGPVPSRNRSAPAARRREFLETFTYTDPHLYMVLLFLILLIWLATAVILLSCKKLDPCGNWMFGVGAVFVLPTLVSGLVMMGLFGFGSGPKLWDMSQIFVTTITAQLESLWLPMRWQRIFDGKSFYLTLDDYVYTALWLAL